MSIKSMTTEQLEKRDEQLTRLISSLSKWHNRRMSKKDRQWFANEYRTEQDAITNELIAREKVAA